MLDELPFEKIPSEDNFMALIVPPNEYFLMGDNRPYNEDSRYIKTLRREDIDPKVDKIIRKEDFENGSVGNLWKSKQSDVNHYN